MFLFGLVAVVAVLVGLLPDWDNNDKDLDQLEQPDLGTNQTTKAEQLFFESTEGPFDAKLPLFSSRITEGYGSEEELAEDLEQLAKLVLNEAITENAGTGLYEPEIFLDEGMAPSAPLEGIAQDTADSDLESATDFGTNNQEESVDKADFIKSDGTYVYAAYGDYLLVWGTDGRGIVAKVRMPPVQNPNNNPPDDVIPEPVVDGTEPIEPIRVSSDSLWWDPTPHIQAMLLDNGRLTVVVSGYGHEKVGALEHTPVLMGYQGSQIRVYEILADGNLRLLSVRDVNGDFRNAYSVGSNAYIVTHSTINTWEHLLAPVQRWLPEFEGLNDDEYIARATEIGSARIGEFTRKLASDIMVDGRVDIARLSVFADSLSSDNIEKTLFSGGVANAITNVVSFDMGVVQENNVASFALDISATFQPGHWGHVYATDGMILVADQGWSWIEEEGVSGQKTYLIGFRLNGPTSSHALVGSVDGYMLNSFSLDFVEKSGNSYVRIATTQDFWVPWMPAILEDTDTIGIPEPIVPVESSTVNRIIQLKIPSAANTDGDKVLEFVGDVTLGEPNERFTTVRFFHDFAYAVTFEQTDPFYVVDLTGEVPFEAGELKIPGFSQYLHPIDANDRYLVAVGQNADETTGAILGLQLSLFDASDPTAPALLDRLDLEDPDLQDQSWSGTSAAWDERAFRFLSLGDRTGKVIIPVSISTWITVDTETGLELEKPFSYQFEGFSVFDINGASITKDFDITHGPPQYGDTVGQPCGYWYSWLPERSMVFSGDVMTMKGYTVMSTDLTTGDLVWDFSLLDENLGCKV